MVGVIWYNLCQFRAVNQSITVSRNYSKNKRLGFFNCKYLQGATLYVDKDTTTEKSYLNTTLVGEKIWPL